MKDIRAIKTNGIGQKSDYHLNLTQSLACFPTNDHPSKGKPRNKTKRVPAPTSSGAPYAGKEK